jgi:hypothetical protein
VEATSLESRVESPRATDSGRREALLKEYGEVMNNIRHLTDIRFKLLAFLPFAVAATAAVVNAGAETSGPSRALSLALSIFGFVATVGVATYNARNDQIYDALIGRAASIERQLSLPDGAFATRPNPWFEIRLAGLRWAVDHRNGMAALYASSLALWLSACLVTGGQLVSGDDDLPASIYIGAVVAAVAVTIAGTKAIGRQRLRRSKTMRELAMTASARVVRLGGLEQAAEDPAFRRACQELLGRPMEFVERRADFYAKLPERELRHYMPTHPPELAAAYFVALITDLPPEWIFDVFAQRR